MDLEAMQLGETSGLEQFDGRRENRDVASALISQAKHKISLFTPNLENPVYDNQDVMSAIRKLASSHRHVRIRILVKDATAAVKTGHRLIETARHFSTSIQIHKTPKDTENIDTAYLLIDDAGYLYKHHGELFQGQFNFNDKFRVRELSKVFDEAWDRSSPDPELRRLYI